MVKQKIEYTDARTAVMHLLQRIQYLDLKIDIKSASSSNSSVVLVVLTTFFR